MNTEPGIFPLRIELSYGRLPKPFVSFTVAGESRNVATWENDIGSIHEGAAIAGSSGQYGSGYAAQYAIDDNVDTYWLSASRQVQNQYIIIQLPQQEVVEVHNILEKLQLLMR